MKLDKPDALMLHSVLFAYVNSNVNLEFIDVDHLQSLQERLQDFITQEQESERHDCETEEELDDEETDDYDDEDEDDVDTADEQDEQIEVFVTAKDVSDLSPLKVVSLDGSTVSLEFEDVGEDDMVDALIDEGAIIVDSVVKLVVDEKCVSLHDGEEWHDFKVVKLSKSWRRAFPMGKIVGFSAGEE